jgi:hypothetical protein
VAETDYNPGRLDLGGLNLKLNGKEAIVPDLLWVNANNDAERQLATPGDEVGRWRFETGAMVAKRTFRSTTKRTFFDDKNIAFRSSLTLVDSAFRVTL